MRVLIFACMLVLIACNSEVKGKNGVVYKNALQYNQYIMTNQKKVINVILAFGEAIKSDLDSADRILDRGLKKTDEALNDIKGMPSFKGDSAFRKAAINSFEFYKDIMGNEYKEIIRIRKKGENTSEEDITFLRELPTSVGKREEKLDRNFRNAQKEFAKKNHLTLVKNEMQEKIDKSDKKEY